MMYLITISWPGAAIIWRSGPSCAIWQHIRLRGTEHQLYWPIPFVEPHWTGIGAESGRTRERHLENSQAAVGFSMARQEGLEPPTRCLDVTPRIVSVHPCQSQFVGADWVFYTPLSRLIPLHTGLSRTGGPKNGPKMDRSMMYDKHQHAAPAAGVRSELA